MKHITIKDAAALPLSTPIRHRWKKASFTSWCEDTRTLSDWLDWARKQADRADHEPENTPYGILSYLVADFYDFEFYV
jgi:hypothetical protein